MEFGKVLVEPRVLGGRKAVPPLFHVMMHSARLAEGVFESVIINIALYAVEPLFSPGVERIRIGLLIDRPFGFTARQGQQSEYRKQDEAQIHNTSLMDAK